MSSHVKVALVWVGVIYICLAIRLVPDSTHWVNDQLVLPHWTSAPIVQYVIEHL